MHWVIPQSAPIEKHCSNPQGKHPQQPWEPQESSTLLAFRGLPSVLLGRLPEHHSPHQGWQHGWRCLGMLWVVQTAWCNSVTAAAKGQTNRRSHLLSVADGCVCPGNQGPELSGWCRQVLSKLLCILLQAPWGPAFFLKVWHNGTLMYFSTIKAHFKWLKKWRIASFRKLLTSEKHQPRYNRGQGVAAPLILAWSLLSTFHNDLKIRTQKTG